MKPLPTSPSQPLELDLKQHTMQHYVPRISIEYLIPPHLAHVLLAHSAVLVATLINTWYMVLFARTRLTCSWLSIQLNGLSRLRQVSVKGSRCSSSHPRTSMPEPRTAAVTAYFRLARIRIPPGSPTRRNGSGCTVYSGTARMPLKTWHHSPVAGLKWLVWTSYMPRLRCGYTSGWQAVG